MNNTLLIEIGTEELPAIPLLNIIENIQSSWEKILKKYRLSCDFDFYYTPRRLVLFHKNIALVQSSSQTELFGPPVMASLKDGVATGAGLGFAKKCGVAFEELGVSTKGGKEVLYFCKQEEGEETKNLLQSMIKAWLESMNFGKMMRWGARKEEFIRPIHWIQARLNDENIDVNLYGVQSSTYTYIHRMRDFTPKEVQTTQNYEEILKNGNVILNPKAREEKILKEFEMIEKNHDISIEIDDELLAEVVAITEYPTALLGSFDELFLELPPEVIITSMKENQRYFPVFEKGKLSNKFIVVSNAVTKDFSFIIAGNERVLKPRLSDALFFYRNDLARGLRIDGLEKITFMDGLGSLKDKVVRESNIATLLAQKYMPQLQLQTNKQKDEIITLIHEASMSAKADLMSEMVYEFTELQGLMGYYYSLALGKDSLVANAIKEQYLPTKEGGELPSNLFSSIVALSIKLDTLMGLFSVGKIPSGSKDPFALRRAVNGIIRIVIENSLNFDINEILTLLSKNYAPFETKILSDFILERIYKSFGSNVSIIASVISSGERDILKMSQKVNALNSVLHQEGATNAFATFKRVANISKDVDISQTLEVDEKLFKDELENVLYNRYTQIVSKNFDSYETKLKELFGLQNILEQYFEKIMVNVEDEKLRTNRLNSIASIYKTFLEFADLKEISI
ncbi:MAG: glycine--tRNA ligase subunit beta [Epsilonproteobacteria bacterium]|nr:glycine--tRNA ligase subunit beta [Campylobacterota bacterium]